MKTNIKFSLLLCVLLNIPFLNSNAQNLKKLFKNIENGEMSEADKEYNKFDENKKHSNKDLYLIGIATCLIEINEKSVDYEPYTALTDYKKITIPEGEISEVNDFLQKFNYNYNTISDLIFQKILVEAKKSNTEISYQKALSVCTPCNYKLELNTLKEKAAYNECKSLGTIDAFKYFLNQYSNSDYKNEITLLLENKVFSQAQTIMSVKSMNDFIESYPKSKLKIKAIDIRDSLALPREPQSYSKLSDYIRLYPNSKYISSVKKEMPNVLYKEAISNNSIDVLKSFINIFPNDSRVNEIREKLEIAYANLLNKKFNISEFNSFKSLFPNSKFMNELKIVYTNKIKDSDLAKEQLKGNIKSIETKVNDGKDGYIIRVFNEFGKTEKFDLIKNYYDKIEKFEANNYPKEFTEEFLFISPIGFFKSTLYCGNKYDGASGNAHREIINFEYDSDGKLVKVDNIEFKYDLEGNLIEKDFNTIHNGSYSPTIDGWGINKIKYKWQDKKLISKHAYNDKGDRYDKFYDIDYKGNQQIIKEHTGDKEKPGRIYTLTYNIEGEITSKSLDYCDHYERATGVAISRKYDINYIYENGYLTNIGGISINRDSHGNILTVENYAFLRESEWSYEYDGYGNWIKRIEYDVKNGDIKIKKKINEIIRIITYF